MPDSPDGATLHAGFDFVGQKERPAALPRATGLSINYQVVVQGTSTSVWFEFAATRRCPRRG